MICRVNEVNEVNHFSVNPISSFLKKRMAINGFFINFINLINRFNRIYPIIRKPVFHRQSKQTVLGFSLRRPCIHFLLFELCVRALRSCFTIRPSKARPHLFDSTLNPAPGRQRPREVRADKVYCSFASVKSRIVSQCNLFKCI